MKDPRFILLFVVLTGCGSQSGVIAERTRAKSDLGDVPPTIQDAGVPPLEPVSGAAPDLYTSDPLPSGTNPSAISGQSAASTRDQNEAGQTLDIGQSEVPDASDRGSEEIEPGDRDVFSYPAPCEAVVESDAMDVHISQLGFATSCEEVQLTLATSATIGASSADGGALTIDGEVPVTVVVRGAVIGAGGRGGSGGNGGSGSPYCGRDGSPGGPAVVLRTHATVVVEEGGMIAGGGGGGGGFSGGNEAGGGGGGAGYVAGLGGAGATSLSEADELAFCGQDNGYRTGKAGKDAKGMTPGSSSPSTFPTEGCRGSGAGGRLGQPGQDGECYGSSSGGAAGAAIERGRFTAGVPDGDYADVDAPIRGPVRE